MVIIIKRIFLVSFFITSIVLMALSSLMAADYRISKYVPQTKRVAIPWTNGSSSISIGRFRYFNDKGEERETYENYLVVWRCNGLGKECDPLIVNIIEGYAPEIILDDLNEDGIKEIIISYYKGAHTQYWRVYQEGEDHQRPEMPFMYVGEIWSDWPLIKRKGKRENGYHQIEVRNRNYPDFSKCKIVIYSWVDGKYRKTSSKYVDMKTWGK